VKPPFSIKVIQFSRVVINNPDYIALLFYYHMFSCSPATPPDNNSMVLPYTSDQYRTLFSSLRQGNMLLAAAALMVILGDFLPVLLSNIPFARTVTWTAHNICSWLAVAILSIMTLTLVLVCVVIVVGMVFKRPKQLPPVVNIDIDLVRDYPLLATVLFVCSSSLPLPKTSVTQRRQDGDLVNGNGNGNYDGNIRSQ